MSEDKMRVVSRVLETAIYADDFDGMVAFYRTIFAFEALVDTPRLCAFDVGGVSVLLIFQRGATRDGLSTEGGWIPAHDGSGPTHFAFGISLDDVEWWETQLALHGIDIESRVTWPRGGVSLYFRDPENHSVELVTQGTWSTY
jgi:catechol 2,3-dioxygenase-like lactoylglutathione lyase family enzyme